jgi:HSP20 family protein
MYISITPTNWSIFDDLIDWHNDFNRLFNETRPIWSVRRYPAVNTWVSEGGIIVDVEIPGIDPKKLEVSVYDNELTISGIRDTERPEKDGSYHLRERMAGNFKRLVTLPYVVDTEKVEAKYKNGVLRIKLTRAEADKPQKILIEAV